VQWPASRPPVALGYLRTPVAPAVTVVGKNMDHYPQKPPFLKVVCNFLDHYPQSTFFKDRLFAELPTTFAVFWALAAFF